jgi:amino acid adenylation domain-containing protein
MPAALRIDGNLDVGVLERTLQALVQRHEVLRSRFVLRDGLPLTIIDAGAHFRLDLEDLHQLSPSEQDRVVQASAGAEFDLPFDLSAGPLVRARLLTLAPEAQVLLLTTHHIVSDGWSTVLLITDLVRLYAAFLRDLPSPLPPLEVQYADFAEWQRGWLTGPVLDTQLAYWKRQLAGAPAVVQLPTDRPRPPVQRFEGATTTFALGSELAAAIGGLSTRTGATTFMTMLAAFFVLLSRYTRQSDLVVGSPMAGRNRKELEPVVGFFLNTLVLRADLGGDPTFRELVERVRHVVLDAYAHQDVPFEQIVETLQPDRSTSVTPLFQIVFSGAMTQASTLALPDVRVTPLPPAKVAAKFDLTVGFGESAGDITGAFEYNTGLFDEATMRRMASHYRTLLAAAAAAPDARISTLSMLPDGERDAAFARGAAGLGSHAGTARIQTVPARIAATAARRPTATAVGDASTSLTYAELSGRADALARELRARGVARESRVAVCVERSAQAVVALLAVLRAGAAYVPLDPALPLDRLRFMLADSGATVTIVSAATRGHDIVAAAPQTIDVDAFVAQPPGVPLPAVDDLDALAYVIYTSGSTGVPKGVAVSHRALANLVDWHTAAFQISSSDRGSQVASLAFDAAVWETWPYLAAGAELHVADDITVRSPSALLELLVSRRITVAFLPTPLAEQMLRGQWRGVALRYLLTGGDRLHDCAPRDLPFTLVNNYGPTENAVVASSGVVPGLPIDRPAGAPSIGQPIHGTQIYLLDERLELVPAGVPGEIAIGGQSLARGYQARPDMTAARFVPDPFGGQPGARLYLSGDLARWRDDGSLEFLRRIDRQVKVRGYRIELGELESVLARHAEISRAAAMVRGDGAAATLEAFVESRAPLTAQALRSYLRERVPEYMIPATLVVVESMPLTASGKIDLAVLAARAVDPERPVAVPPRTAAERLVSQVWAEVLGVAAVGAHDNFFEVGGHSLKLIEVHGRLEQTLGRELSVVDLFRYPTVAGLAAFLSPEEATTEDAVLSAAEQRAERQRAASRARRPPVGTTGPEQHP